MIRGACILLMIVGAVTVLFSAPVALNGANARCHLARAWVEQANTDNKDWNNVDTGATKPEDLNCDDAVRYAGDIKLNEKGTKKAKLPSQSALQTQNTVAVVMGLGQAIAGFSIIRSPSRFARNLAIGASAVAGLFLQVLSIFSLGVFVFVVYAFVFSPAGRELWPKEAT